MFGRHQDSKGLELTRRDLVRAEMEEGIDHLRQAVAHLASGLGAGVGPGIGTARQMAKDRSMQARGLMNNPRMGAAASRARDAASKSWDMSRSALGPLAEAARMGSARATEMNDDESSGGGMMSRMMFASSRRGGAVEDTEQASGGKGMYKLLAGGAALGAAGALAARRRTRTKWAEYEPSSVSSDAESFIGAGATSGKDFSRRESGTSKASHWAKDHARGAYDSMRARREHGHHHDGEHGHQHSPEAMGGPGGPGMVPGANPNVGPMGDDEVDQLIRSAKNNGRM